MMALNRKLMSMSFIVLVALWSFVFHSPALSHEANQTYIYLQVGETGLTGRFEGPVTDLDRIFDLDSNGDKQISNQEIAAKFDLIKSAMEKSLSFNIGGKPASITLTEHKIQTFGEHGYYAFLDFNVNYSGEIPEEIGVRYSGFMQKQLPGYQVLLLIEDNARTGLKKNGSAVSLYLGADGSEQSLDLKGPTAWESFRLFVWHGFYHILIGFDHIAFLIAILLPSVLLARDGRWAPLSSFKEASINVVKIVTTFTIAHSVTLSLASLNIVELPQRAVEIAIALSIVAAIIANLTIVGRSWTLLSVFVLGLLHGLGFAFVMLPLGVAKTTLIQSLFGFNVGVELGQLLIVAVVFPILWLISRTKYYVRYVLHGGSLVLLLMAVYWFAERALLLPAKLIAGL